MNSRKLKAYMQLMRLDKPIGILLLLWPTCWALWLANNGMPSLHLLLIFVLGVILMRSAGCVINDFADRDFDGHVERTKNRPLPSKQVTEKESKILFSLLIIISFLLVLTLNTFTISLSLVALLLAFVYPFMKRITYLPQLILGMAFGWAIPMAYGATLGYVPLEGWLLFIANITWTIAYDTMYAMVDKADDIKINVKSTAILFGKYDKLVIMLLQIVTVLLLIFIAVRHPLSDFFYFFLLLTMGLFIYQSILIRKREREHCFNAFLNNNYVGLVIFLGILFSI